MNRRYASNFPPDVRNVGGRKTLLDRKKHHENTLRRIATMNRSATSISQRPGSATSTSRAPSSSRGSTGPSGSSGQQYEDHNYEYGEDQHHHPAPPPQSQHTHMLRNPYDDAHTDTYPSLRGYPPPNQYSTSSSSSYCRDNDVVHSLALPSSSSRIRIHSIGPTPEAVRLSMNRRSKSGASDPVASATRARHLRQSRQRMQAYPTIHQREQNAHDTVLHPPLLLRPNSCERRGPIEVALGAPIRKRLVDATTVRVCSSSSSSSSISGGGGGGGCSDLAAVSHGLDNASCEQDSSRSFAPLQRPTSGRLHQSGNHAATRVSPSVSPSRGVSLHHIPPLPQPVGGPDISTTATMASISSAPLSGRSYPLPGVCPSASVHHASQVRRAIDACVENLNQQQTHAHLQLQQQQQYEQYQQYQQYLQQQQLEQQQQQRQQQEQLMMAYTHQYTHGGGGLGGGS